jgi:murein DD-endopeptidase MepM/ murein hydrolase activator NlpD
MVLGSTDSRNGAAVTFCSKDDPAYRTEWTFEFDGIINTEGYEFALYPSETVYITQGAYGSYSHQRQNALDITTSNGSVYAPFTGEIVRIDRGYSRYNTVWLQSCDKVVYADGSMEYMTVVFMHDNNVTDLSLGQIVTQGEYFYDMGVAGGATGSHVHIAIIRGKYSSTMSLTGSGNVYVEDALFLTPESNVILGYGLDWNYLEP